MRELFQDFQSHGLCGWWKQEAPARLMCLVHFIAPVLLIRSEVFTSSACAACDGLGSAWKTTSRAKGFQLGQFLVQDVKDGDQL